MPRKAEEVFRRVFERNPEVDPEDLEAALKEQMLGDPVMSREIHHWAFGLMYPIVVKKADGKPLSKAESAVLKMFDPKQRLSKAEQTAAAAYVESFRKDHPAA